MLVYQRVIPLDVERILVKFQSPTASICLRCVDALLPSALLEKPLEEYEEGEAAIASVTAVPKVKQATC